MDKKYLEFYQLVQEKKLPDINSIGYVLKHKKSGARVVFISNDDNNKTFSIGFRTPPKDNTGVAHIMEHSVLCGSKKFPVKDPFMELAKGSLNTFLNAMTYPDKTVYPVSSTNDKDFKNLVDVYLDAVFHPNIYQREEIFRQEGFTYSLKDKDSDLIYNGVVYNEMKGAFSSPDDVIDRIITESLYPDTCYGVESGGNPDYIPDLTYQEFLNFHKKYYHPSNSYIYIYGDMNMDETLLWLNEEYLQEFENIKVDSEISYQKPFGKLNVVREEYSISESEKTEDNTFLSYNFVLGDILDRKLYLAFQILEYALVSMPGAPIKQALLDAGIGKDIQGHYNNYILQPYFNITAKNANEKDKDLFIKIIRKEFQKLVEQGIDRESLMAALNNYEFQYRECDFGSYPKGLMFSFEVFDSWLYDDHDPFRHLEQNDLFAELRRDLETDFYEKLIEKYFLENPHTSLVVLAPMPGLTIKKDEALKQKLAKIKESMTEDEINALIKRTKELEEYQGTPSTQEELEKIPMLKIEDISKEVEPFYNTIKEECNIPVVQHDLFTNGIGYLNLSFDVTNLPFEQLPYLMLLKGVLGYMDTEKYSYTELSNEIGIHTGGIYPDITVYRDSKNYDEFTIRFELKGKVFFDKLEKAFSLINEIIFNTKFDDTKRLYEIVCEGKSGQQSSLMRSSDAAAVLRNLSYFSKVGAVNEKLRGLSSYKFIENVEKNYESNKTELVNMLKKMASYVFRKDNLIIGYTANDDGYRYLPECVKIISNKLHGPENKNLFGSKSLDDLQKEIPVERKNEGIKSSSQVQYVTRAGNFREKGYDYDPSLRVLRTILNYEYLWINVRVKGGAYGCNSMFSKAGDAYFSSYRDPNLASTNEIFSKIPNYVKTFNVDDRDMRKYIIGTISSMDTPLTPFSKGNRSMLAYLTHEKLENLKAERLGILETNQQKIRDLEGIIKAITEENNLCVIGNEANITENEQLFSTTLNLFE